MRRLLPVIALLAGCPPNSGDTDFSIPDLDEDGFDEEVDCDDGDAAIFPGADELCNEIDDDCDGEIDEQAIDRKSFYRDDDADGFGLDSQVVIACFLPLDHAEVGGDCDDADRDRYPGQDELCNDVDDDCNDVIDDNPVDGSPWYPDRDQDGYGGDADVVQACRPVPEHIPTGGDCDDSDDDINPEGQEVCDRGDGDEDCDGLINDDDDTMIDAPSWYVDSDGDGYGDRDDPLVQCAQPEGRVAIGEDCEDTLAEVNPEATEICGNGLDDDCNDHAATCGVVGAMGVDLADTRWEGVQSGAELGGAIFGLPDQDGDSRGELGFSQDRFDGPGSLVNVGRANLVYGPALGGDTRIVDHVWPNDVKDQRFARYILVAGDLDGDDLTEIWFSANNVVPASVRLQDLEDETATLVLQSVATKWDAFGSSLANLLDVTDDGVSDVIIGAPRAETLSGPALAGAAYVFDASADGIVETGDAEAEILGDTLAGRCGTAVDGGDYDGDGASDLSIGCPGASSDVGVVLFFDEVPTGSVSADDADQTLAGEAAGHLPGEALAHGDLNGDGYDDLIIGAPGSSGAPTFEGAAYAIAGPIPDGADLAGADRIWTGESAKDGFGGVIGTGDVDGDSADEVLFGAAAVARYAGRAYLFEWSDPSSSADKATAVLDGEDPGDFFGASVAVVPDLDNDGFDDAVVGAPGYFVTAKAAGGLWIWRGGPGY